MDSLSSDSLFLSFQAAVAGRYSIDRELGRGGMGVVYLAREVHLDRLVAIKVLPPELAADATLRERFLGEARIAAKLSHPNIIPIHTVEEHDSIVYFVMSYINGETLTERVRSRGPLSSSEGTRVLRDIAWALAYAHNQGLVHRDVKPDNILLEAETGRVFVADFGIAAAMGDVAGVAVTGTPEFMSPEQALGQATDARSDLYGLGATGFFAFSGRLPFEGATSTEILAKQISQPAPPLASLGLTVPRRLAHLINTCLAKEPDDRPVSAQQLAAVLGEGLEQRRDTPLPLRAFVKRHGRFHFGSMLAFLIIFSSGFALAGRFLSKAFSLFGSSPLGFMFGVIVIIPVFQLIRAAYRLLQQGYDHGDLKPAFAAEAELAREELGVQLHPLVVIATKVLQVVRNIAVGIALLALLVVVKRELLGGTGADWFQTSRVLRNTIVIAVGATILREAMRRHSVDVVNESWGNFWTGFIGKGIFFVARLFVGKRFRRAAMTHRATELSLGMAVEQLFAALPKETQRELGGIPAVLKHLQNDAKLLRHRYEELQEVINSTATDAASSPHFAKLTAVRDEVHAKLSEAVATLETIRINLLMLHGGSVTVASLSAHLSMAVSVSEDVKRLVEARREVDDLLAFPALASSSG